MKKFVKNKYGFTLVEIILYVTILSILLVGVVQLSIIIKQSGLKFNSYRTVQTDGSNFLTNLDFLVKNSSGFAKDNTGPCYDFSGTQGPSDYYLSLYFNTSSATTVLPPECPGKGNTVASTTAVKIYWRGGGYNSIWMDCYRAFINGNAGNCTTIRGEGNIKFRLTSDNDVAVYDGGLSLATTTAGGNTALEVSLTMGIPGNEGAIFSSATTTASTTSAFRVQVADAQAPVEAVAGDHVLGGSEVCDSDLTSACALNASYYKGQYVEDDSTCNGAVACNATASACLTSLACNGS